MKKYIFAVPALVVFFSWPVLLKAQITTASLNTTTAMATFSYINNLNTQINKLAPNYSNQVTAVTLRTLLEDRKNEMLGLAKINPKLFLTLALSATDRTRWPLELQAKVERPTQVEGKLEVWHYDLAGPDSSGAVSGLDSSITRYNLRRGQNKFLLYPTKNLFFRSDTSLRVNGYQLGNALIVNNDIGDAVQATTAVSSLGATGEQRVAVLTVNFSDNRSQSASLFTEITESIYGLNRRVRYGIGPNQSTVRDYYAENSYGRSNFVGSVSDIYGYYTLPMAASNIQNVDLQSLVINQADNDINFSDYNRILIYIPLNSDLLGLGYRGYSSIGKIPVQTNDGLINASVSVLFGAGYFNTYIAAHELGHGLGAYHSGVYECGNKTIDFPNSCQAINNTGNFHGLGLRHLNPHTKEELGWLGPKNIVTVSPNGQFGRYRIYPIELAGDNLKVIKIPISLEFNPGANQPYYYLEFKRGIGFDNVTISIRPFSDPVPRTYRLPDYYDGLMFSMPYFDTLELDLSPHLSTGTPEAWSWDDIEDRLDIVLKQGATFTDQYGRLAVTVVRVNENGNYVDLDVIAPPPPQTLALKIVVPNGAESWNTDSRQTISWRAPAVRLATYDLSLRQSPYGTKASPIAKGLTGSSYQWTVGNFLDGTKLAVEAGTYVVRICQSGTTICDESDKPFNIILLPSVKPTPTPIPAPLPISSPVSIIPTPLLSAV